MTIENLIDFDFDKDFDISLDETGDVKTNRGMDAAVGSIVLRSADVIRDFVGGQNTPTRREQMRSKVEDEFVELGYTNFNRLVVTEVDDESVSFSLVVSVDETYDFSIDT